MDSLRGIFDGVKVLSLAEQYPGPYATLLLADLGADVVLVERPRGGDPSRVFAPFFRALARNKRSCCIDLKAPEGQAQLRALARNADVVLEGFRPGTMDRLGVGYEALREHNPRLIYASISGFGQTGPYRDRTAHDLSYQAVSGLLFDQIGQERLNLPTVAFGDLGSAMFAAFAVAAALYGREKTGLGTSIDVSMTDGLVSWMTTFLGPAMSGEPAFAVFEEPAYGAFACKGGARLTLSIAHEDHFWRALCEVLELPEAAALKGPERVQRNAELRSAIAGKLLLQPLEHWAPLFDARSIPWSPLNTLQQVLDDPHFRARGLFGAVARKGIAEGHVLQPVKFSAYGSSLRRPSPELGEHTAEVIEEYGRGS
jgi:crotonobetainyl-CoA:carnitine CoA-transferase CaiB-like acyl-CoA transferase